MLASSSFFPSVDDDDDLFSMKLVLLHRSILPDLQQPEENHQHQQQMLDPSSFMQNFTILAIKDLQEPHTDLFLTRSLNLLCHQSELSLFHKHELLLFPLAVRILRRLPLFSLSEPKTTVFAGAAFRRIYKIQLLFFLLNTYHSSWSTESRGGVLVAMDSHQSQSLLMMM
jgi:hypothetical protein